MRITGLATGMDVDSIVKDTMKPYRIKVDKAKQDKEIYEMKQQLYRDVLKESQDFYNKYLDVAKKDSILLGSNWGTVNFSSSNENVVSATGLSGAVKDNYTVDIAKLAKPATAKISSDEVKEADKIKVSFEKDGKTETIEISTKSEKLDADGNSLVPPEFITKDSGKIVEELNVELKAKGSEVTARYSSFSGGNIVLETKSLGKEAKFDLALEDSSGTVIKQENANGENAEVKITNSKGDVFTHTGNANAVVVDGVKFDFHEETKIGESIKLTGKTDITKTKDMIVNFVNDYNKLMESINTKIYEKRNKSYMPLTEEQKKEMSEEEIKMWEKKTKEGLLSRDSDLQRITNSMKNAFSPLMGQLQKIGISPVSDYSNKNGMFIIDDAKLTAALENNPSEVRDIFIKQPTSETSKDGGILHTLKDVLYKETITVDSQLIKKVGMIGSATATNNEYTKIMEKKQSQIDKMLKDLTTKENQLYSKWARLETQMSKLNSQNSYLMSQFGGGM